MGITGLRSAAEIVVHGRVQGVGYRNFVQRKAVSLGLAGYVMNLKDGKVRVRVEGGRDLIEELMHDLKKRVTILIVTHNMQQAARVSDFTAYMYLGELVEFGVTDELFIKPRKKQTEDYITGRFG